MTDKLSELAARLYAAGVEPGDLDLEALLEKAKGDVDIAADLATPAPEEGPKPPAKKKKPEQPAPPTQADYADAQPQDVRMQLYALRWMELLVHPSVGVIAGRKRHGKTGLAYWLAIQFARKYGINPYVAGLPSSKWYLVQASIRPIAIDEIYNLPENSVVIVDEAAIHLYARKWQGNQFSEVMQQIIALSGQRKQTLIFVTHNFRKFDIAVLADIDWLVMKRPSQFHYRLEREKFQEISLDALRKFERIRNEEEVKATAYVFCDDAWGERLMNPLPDFWSQELSEAYAGLTLEGEPTKAVAAAPSFDWFRHDPVRK